MEKSSIPIELFESCNELHCYSHFSLLSQRHENSRLFVAKRNEQNCVIKVLKKTNRNSNEQNRIRNEARFSFEIEGLPNVLDLVELEDYVILIRTFAPGVALPDFWKKVKRKDRIRTLKLLIDNLVPLFSELTRSKVLHLDIKPSNILITTKEDRIKVHIIDFGLARFQGDNVKSSTFFPLGYAAPELVLNQLELLDHRTDLFSLGILIWELFEGEIPLSHSNPLIMTNLQLNIPLPEGASIPSSLLALLQKMTNKYSFPRPPNQLETRYVCNKLMEAMDKRYSDLSDFRIDLNAITEKHHWLIKLFSKS
jgi:serine/threonine protein kinase